MATIRDVARIAGVSVSTVSLAMNQRERVSSETFRKVMRAAESAGYIANPIAKSLRVGSSPLIGLVVSDIRTAFAQSLLRELEQRFFDKGFLIALSDNSGEGRDQGEVLNRLVAQRAAGILYSPNAQNAEHLQTLERSGIPTILVDRKIEGSAFDYIGLNNRFASEVLLRHLTQLGHRDIGFITGTTGVWTSEERLAGFLSAAKAAGISSAESNVASGDFTQEGGYRAATKLLCSAQPITALIAANNEMLIGALRAAKDLGFSVPQDISMCSIDGAPWGQDLEPKITHVAQPVKEMSELAANWLLDRIGKTETEVAPRSREFEARFVQGGSCAPPKS